MLNTVYDIHKKYARKAYELDKDLYIENVLIWLDIRIKTNVN